MESPDVDWGEYFIHITKSDFAVLHMDLLFGLFTSISVQKLLDCFREKLRDSFG